MDESPQWRRRSEAEQQDKRRHTDRWFLVGGSLILAGLLGAAGWWAVRSREPLKKPPAAVVETKQEAPPPAEMTFQGMVQGRNIIAIAAPLEGTLEALEVQKGAAVFEEQLLGRVKNLGLESAREASRLEAETAQDRVNNLESALIAARLEASRTAADADRARAEFSRLDKLAQRQRILYNEGVTPRLAHEKAEKEMEAARGQADASSELARQSEQRIGATQQDLDNAKKVLEEKLAVLEDSTGAMQAAEIRSPVDGVLVGIRVEQGAEVTPDMEDLFQIAVNPGELMVIVEPDPEQRKAMDEALASGPLAASVQIVELAAAMEGKCSRGEDGKVRVEFNAGDPNVKPGLNAIVRVKLR
ncbi:MAG: hypothetical protein R2762_23650 [Bryobacteraceae bacterium]